MLETCTETVTSSGGSEKEAVRPALREDSGAGGGGLRGDGAHKRWHPFSEGSPVGSELLSPSRARHVQADGTHR